MTSVYDGLYDREFILTLTIGGSTVSSANGRRTQESTETKTVRVWFESESRPTILAQIGADSMSEAVRGRCISPVFFPSGFISGSPVKVTSPGASLDTARDMKLLIPERSPFSLEDELEGQLFYGKLS